MPHKPFSSKEQYTDVVHGLLRLHELEVAGRSDSDEADAVRDRIEYPWHLLSKPEKARITGLSEDLYSITNPQAIKPPNPQSDRKLMEAYKARNSGQWDKSLELLRRWGKHVEAAKLAYFRGSIWKDAGDAATASVFLKQAADLDSDYPNYYVLFLNTLHTAHPEKAQQIAVDILANHSKAPPVIVVQAAEIRFASAREMPEAESHVVFKELVQILQPTLIELESDSSYNDSMFAIALTLLASCQNYLGNISEALAAYNRSITANPGNDALLIARGILRYGRDSESLHDFQSAIRLHTPLVWPFFFLAHNLLINDRFEDCMHMSERALDKSAPDSVRADLLEWIAIAKFELGAPPQEVRQAFMDSVRLAPNNNRIRTNFSAFNGWAASQMQPIVWEKLTEETIQAFGHRKFRPALAA